MMDPGLANRKSWVTIQGAKFRKATLKQHVHQGTVLLPLLLLLYIDDLYLGSWDLHNSLFADDMAIWAQDSKLHNLDIRWHAAKRSTQNPHIAQQTTLMPIVK